MLPSKEGATSVSDHQLLLFLVDVGTLFLAARVGGEVAARIGIPLHVGELLAGIALGPSLLGWLSPGAFEALFPADPVIRSVLEIMNWLGIIFLVTLAGLETRLGVLKEAGRAVLGAWIGGFFLPFAFGFALGMVFPASLVPPGVERPVFALFLAVAMSLSAIPVIARILMDLGMFQTRTGMVIMSSALADDTIGWIVLAVVAGLATGSGGGIETAAWALAGTGLFVGTAFTVGRPLVKRAVKASRRLRVPHAETSAILLLVFVGGAITQAIGVHLVLGCFVMAILIGRTPKKDPQAIESIRHIGMGFLVPFFFTFTGIKVDLTAMRGGTFLVMVAAVLVACLGKVVGGSIGARLGGLPKWEALSVGVGLNARGAMELVIAAVGLSIGILNEASYAIIVVIAITTTVMAAPLLRATMRRAVAAEELRGAGRDAGSDGATAAVDVAARPLPMFDGAPRRKR